MCHHQRSFVLAIRCSDSIKDMGEMADTHTRSTFAVVFWTRQCLRIMNQRVAGLPLLTSYKDTELCCMFISAALCIL
jgi:hypothetical protein